MVSNRTLSEIAIGDGASSARRLTVDDLYIFARSSGNLNPLNLPGLDSTGDGLPDEPVAPPLWVASIVAAIVGNRLPGPGTVWHSIEAHFLDTVRLDNEIVATVTVLDKHSDRLTLGLRVTKTDGTTVLEGRGIVSPARLKIDVPHIEVPEIKLDRHQLFERLIAAAGTLQPLVTAIAVPEDAISLDGVMVARDAGLIDPILVGNRARIEAASRTLGKSIDHLALLEAADEEAAAARAVALVLEGRAEALMKGHLHTDTLLHHIVKKDGGLTMDRRISHVFVLDVPGRVAPLFITDAAININPDLEAKVSIVQNAIDLGHALGLPVPRVGILSAIEVVNPKIPSSIDAAVLSKMAERGQITGGLVDGPLAMDNAVDLEAARTKGITSLVAGRAEILVVPNLETGNMLVKELTFLASAEAAGVVVGARVPIMLTSRADDVRTRLASAAIARLQAHYAATGTALLQFVQ